MTRAARGVYGAALDNGGAITADGAAVSDELFERVSAMFSTEEIVVLTELIAWENASARFNRALGVASQHLWKPEGATTL